MKTFEWLIAGFLFLLISVDGVLKLLDFIEGVL